VVTSAALLMTIFCSAGMDSYGTAKGDKSNAAPDRQNRVSREQMQTVDRVIMSVLQKVGSRTCLMKRHSLCACTS
jgi:hypothetical protein